MSTGLNCEIREVAPNKWYYILEHYNAPKNSWDWYEYATAWGPFPSQDSADQHLTDNHANPGGCYVEPYDANIHASDSLKNLISNAISPHADRLARRW